MMKPLPYVTLSKVHDCLGKIYKFLTKNDPEFRCGLIWKGKNHLEIFAKVRILRLMEGFPRAYVIS
ncbi:hypothetical protein TELCIR_16657 [Teladorsagia circumcincta]|uniref:Uncharacterized protein n=1 Tax=Teladorsagia circumcincta TaxID=45464 RepID=A0A2G9TV51_TELCI|nr:hypothetical protein TELCIR_16657 [Teladorsagia circumcincta]